MIDYSMFDWKNIQDRTDLAFSPYIAAIDIQYAHYSPYVWSFTLDSVGTATGRTWKELRSFLHRLQNKMQLSKDHVLVIVAPDLSAFFGNTKKELDYVPEPFVAKSGSEVLLAAMYGGAYQLHCYKAYFESDLDRDMMLSGIYIPKITTDELSSSCKLSDDELNYCKNRSYYIAEKFREELDLKYGSGSSAGSPKALPLTLTARVLRLISAEMRKASNAANCNIQAQIMKKNPITSEWGRAYLLPMLYKAFFGGVAFFEEDTLDQEFQAVKNADLTSAYIARQVLSRFPVGEFFEMQLPKSYRELLHAPYTSFAMLITFEATEVELRPGALPFLPSQLRHSWADTGDTAEQQDLIERTSSTRIKAAKLLRMTLTDIDFKLFLENYKGKSIRILNVLGSQYGYLPDYIINVIVRLYGNKMKAKHILKELEAAGPVSEADKEDYNRIKSEPARLYGIFTKSPIVQRYVYDQVLQDSVLAEEDYISPLQKYSPVLYQWGVWTTALVRKEIADLRRRFMDAPADRQIRVLSGDTDCINYAGDATDIISDYNRKVKQQIQRRAEALGIDPANLEDLGALSVKEYKLYKITGLKQYAYIRETETGDVFEYKVGGMSTTCEYFDNNFRTPLQRFRHFGLGLTIPAKDAPRVMKVCVVKDYIEEWTDREGNKCYERIKSHMQTINKKFTIYDISSAGPLSNPIRPEGTAVSLQDLKEWSRKVCCPVFDPKMYKKI